jgi:hypothetical protein
MLKLAARFAAVPSFGYWWYVLLPVFKLRVKVSNLLSLRAAMLQIPISYALAMTALGFGTSWLLVLVCPPLLIPIASVAIEFPIFLLPILVASTILAVISFFAFRFLFWKLRYWAWTIATLIFVIALLLVGEIQTSMAQGKAIVLGKFDCISIKSFWHSSHLANEEFKFQFHTTAMRNGKPYGWSFKTMNFFEIPENTFKDIGPIC